MELDLRMKALTSKGSMECQISLIVLEGHRILASARLHTCEYDGMNSSKLAFGTKGSLFVVGCIQL
jgi:hypothetical protein